VSYLATEKCVLLHFTFNPPTLRDSHPPMSGAIAIIRSNRYIYVGEGGDEEMPLIFLCARTTFAATTCGRGSVTLTILTLLQHH